ncbi:MAG: sodium ion-translocating decarboxylase subunit beta [Anaerolineae bacterium]|nr:sodium ion-translocating decarboxylase subunit beta [Anaerolineae bacterium]
MMAIGGLLIYLAVTKEYEPALLLPIGMGCILANLFGTGMGILNIKTVPWVSPPDADAEGLGLFNVLYQAGITNELFPLIIFVGIGAMTDFGPLLENPQLALMGAAGQFGIFGTLLLATLFGFDIREAAAIGIIGSADGPTSIYVAAELAPRLLPPIAVAAYSYMSLVPVIQPPVIRLLTTKRQRRIHMPYTSRQVSRATRVLFPIIVTLVTSILVPLATPLISMLMFGNLLRESLVVDRLSDTAQNALTNIVTIFLGLAIGGTMVASQFLRLRTIGIFVMGIVAFVLDTAGGVLFGQVMYLFYKHVLNKPFNPILGACGISAFPMSARVVHQLAQKEDYTNFLLMHAMGANTSGQIGSVLAGGVVMALLAGAV